MANRMREIATVSPHLVVVEPETAPCVGQALLRGEPVQVGGELVSTAEMLACGLASAPAVAALRRYGTKAIAVGDDTLRQAVAFLHKTPGLQTTPSGAAGLAGLLDVAANSELRHVHGLDHESQVLLLVTERTVCPGDDSRFAKLGLMRAEPDRNNRPLFG
jgi:diaminopropionate ammonia-lyase